MEAARGKAADVMAAVAMARENAVAVRVAVGAAMATVAVVRAKAVVEMALAVAARTAVAAAGRGGLTTPRDNCTHTPSPRKIGCTECTQKAHIGATLRPTLFVGSGWRHCHG